ncbi:hypothetical protein [Pseudomonas aeruginosa]|uniref:hypothetical protein n=1 Tax=Pseudomonas aeruginosa TaxID=287 RepID=UPI0037495F4F|nr:hypothetical protein [Staphylococcus sp.]
MLLRETEDYEKYYKIGNVVMGTAFICIVIFSLMKSTPLTDLSFLKYIHFASKVLLIAGLIINSVPDFLTWNIKNIIFDLIIISFLIVFFIWV